MTPTEFKAIREELGLSQDALARLFGLSGHRTVRKWENGERGIPGPVQILMDLLSRKRITMRQIKVATAPKQSGERPSGGASSPSRSV